MSGHIDMGEFGDLTPTPTPTKQRARVDMTDYRAPANTSGRRNNSLRDPGKARKVSGVMVGKLSISSVSVYFLIRFLVSIFLRQ